MGSFHRAERKRAKARVALCGPAGSGKTMSAILIAKKLGNKIALIDTERGSGELYSDTCDYDVAPISTDFDPRNYVKLIHEAENGGYDVIIIDSLSHAWEGTGGILDRHEKASRGKNSFTAWKDITPQHNALVEAMLQSPAHIIATMRTKTHYDVVEEEKNGKTTTKPVKVGLKPIQREGLDYEFTLVFDLSVDGHIAISSKDRTGLFDGNPDIITEKTGRKLIEWLNAGAEPPPLEKQFSDAVADLKTDTEQGISIKLGSPYYFNHQQHYLNSVKQWLNEAGKGLTENAVIYLKSPDGEQAFLQKFVEWKVQREMAKAATEEGAA